MSKHYHFISIGGSVMHSLAIYLKKQGHQVTGSDDHIYGKSAEQLKKEGLFPEKEGWFEENIHSGLDAVILGMHAKADNPELIKARQLNIPVLSFPEFIYNLSKNKQRIVIAGSHGKTTITALIIHILQYCNREFDYLIGAYTLGLSSVVKISDAPVIVLEGDEYLSSVIDPTPKFHRYQHHIGLISGISWDHANVFPTEDDYVKQFDDFADATPKAGTLIFCDEDPIAPAIGNKEREDVMTISYKTHPHLIENGKTYLTYNNELIPIKIFGKHNMQNVSAAKAVCEKIGITPDEFYAAVHHFEGAHKRLEVVKTNSSTVVINDFAHAPSKVSASSQAVKEQFPDRNLVGCVELHSFSSLDKTFLPHYKNSLKYCNTPIVYYNPANLKSKGLEPLTLQEVREAFNDNRIELFTDTNALHDRLLKQNWENTNLLMMSSGNFNNLDIAKIAEELK
ncbi:MAG: Mur ligase family protein [Cyclobacteriaceae bacterium]|nr:Mur ligase family protein [Cyclobacteriaceae bacterium]